MKDIIHADDSNFSSMIASGVILVDFSAEWCAPCRMLTPILETLASEMAEKLTIVKLDVDEAQKTAASFRIMRVPTMILFKDGKEVNRIEGIKDLDTLKKI